MNLRHPLRVVTPTLDGEILAVLARANKSFTGREVQRALDDASQTGTRHALARLVGEGIVTSEPAGRGILFQLNREHLAAPLIEGLASLRLQLIERLRDSIADWKIKPVVAVLFGSTARDQASAASDLDLLFIRPRGIEADDPAWQELLMNLSESATRWTGNDTRVLEYGEAELPEILETEAVVQDAASEGVVLAGDLRALRARRRRRH